jgi:hypothetical protein
MLEWGADGQTRKGKVRGIVGFVIPTKVGTHCGSGYWPAPVWKYIEVKPNSTNSSTAVCGASNAVQEDWQSAARPALRGAVKIPAAMRLVVAALPLLLASHAALAASVNGAGALALAALVAERSPWLDQQAKQTTALLFDQSPEAGSASRHTIVVRAYAVTCRASNVDITAHECSLSFGGKIVALKGRAAHELFATIAEAGVPADGAAGSVYESLAQLRCTIDPGAILQKSGAGADCTYKPGGG